MLKKNFSLFMLHIHFFSIQKMLLTTGFQFKKCCWPRVFNSKNAVDHGFSIQKMLLTTGFQFTNDAQIIWRLLLNVNNVLTNKNIFQYIWRNTKKHVPNKNMSNVTFCTIESIRIKAQMLFKVLHTLRIYLSCIHGYYGLIISSFCNQKNREGFLKLWGIRTYEYTKDLH